MKEMLFLLLSLALLTHEVHADDLIGKRFSIKRLLVDKDRVAFKLCDANYRPIKCDYIGRSDGYTIYELDNVARSELIEARFKTGGAIVLSIIAFGSGYLAGALIGDVVGAAAVGSGTLAAGETSFIFGVFGAVAGASMPFIIKKVNPFHQYDQSDVLKIDGIYNEMVIKKSDEAVAEIADLMKEILE